MKLRSALGAGALVAGALASQSAAAACTETFTLTSMGPPGFTTIFNDFSSAQSFSDCYDFTLNNSAEAFGLTLEWDLSRATNINIGSVSLSGGSLANTVVDNTPEWFSFSNLLAGSYQLIVAGDVTDRWSFGGGGGSVAYTGFLATTRSGIAAPVPEPETYALLALGLAVVGWSAKRRQS